MVLLLVVVVAVVVEDELVVELAEVAADDDEDVVVVEVGPDATVVLPEVVRDAWPFVDVVEPGMVPADRVVSVDDEISVGVAPEPKVDVAAPDRPSQKASTA